MAIILTGDAQRVISELLPATMPPRPPAPAARPFWQTEPCPSWCTAIHEDSDQNEDRAHFAAGLDVDLNLYRTDLGERRYGPAQAIVSMTQHYRAAEPEIDLTVPTASGDSYLADGEQDVRLSLAEARELRDRLSLILTLVGAE